MNDFSVKPAVLGASIAALGIARSSLLAPQAASALDFTFSFGGLTGLITGLITGLVEGTNSCSGSPCVVTVQSAGSSGAPTGPYFFTNGIGFVVTEGSVTGANWQGVRQPDDPEEEEPTQGILAISSLLGNTNPFDYPDVLQPLGFLTTGFLEGTVDDFLALRFFGREVSFTPAQRPSAAVPGPLPLFGAAAAFGYSRKLRKRTKDRSNISSSAPFA